MTSTVFTPYVTPVPSTWLNDVNGHTYSSTPVSPATTVHPSSVVQYTPAGTGAVATTVQTKLQERVSVFDFMTAAQIADVKAGTLTLGVSAAIQTALNIAGTVEIPAGKYLIDADLVLSDATIVNFSKGASFFASANNRIIFKSTTHAYFTQVNNPTLDGNGFTGVTGMDMTNFRLQAGVTSPFFFNMAVGFIARTGCFGSFLLNPTSWKTIAPVQIIANASAFTIINPNFDNTSGNGGTGAGVGIDIQVTTNLGVTICGGYIQGFDTGIQDASWSTVINGVYFEQCTAADISGVSGARGSTYSSCIHPANVGAAAYKLRNTESISIFNPLMSSSGRAVLYDVDSSNNNCTEYRPPGTSAVNVPTGSLSYIAAVALETSGTFTPVVIGSSTAGAGTYTAQIGTWRKIGKRIFVDIVVGWSAHTGTGNTVVTGVPTSISASFSGTGNLVIQGAAWAGPILYAGFNGTGSNLTMYQVAATGTTTLYALPAAAALVIKLNVDAN